MSSDGLPVCNDISPMVLCSVFTNKMGTLRTKRTRSASRQIVVFGLSSEVNDDPLEPEEAGTVEFRAEFALRSVAGETFTTDVTDRSSIYYTTAWGTQRDLEGVDGS